MSSDLPGLFEQISELKRLKRTGWLDRGVPETDVESVADHSLLTSLISWVVACDDMSLDADRVLKLAVVHDLAESISGDPTPYEPGDIPVGDAAALRAFFSVRHPRSAAGAAVKREAEAQAIKQLLSMMPSGAAKVFRELWDEYEAQDSAESQFVRQADRLEAFLQSRDYVERHSDLPFDGFRLQALEEITHPVLAQIRDDRLA